MAAVTRSKGCAFRFSACRQRGQSSHGKMHRALTGASHSSLVFDFQWPQFHVLYNHRILFSLFRKLFCPSCFHQGRTSRCPHHAAHVSNPVQVPKSVVHGQTHNLDNLRTTTFLRRFDSFEAITAYCLTPNGLHKIPRPKSRDNVSTSGLRECRQNSLVGPPR